MYQYMETEEETKHGDDADAEVKYEEMLVANGVIAMTKAEEEALLAKKSVEAQTTMQMILCSCGSPRCYAINRFGLPKPVFKQDIEPIGCQMTRDMTALRIKQSN